MYEQTSFTLLPQEIFFLNILIIIETLQKN